MQESLLCEVGGGGVLLSRKCLRDRLEGNALEIAQCDSINGQSFKSKKYWVPKRVRVRA